MNSTPKLSIITPVLNATEYMRGCLECVSAQCCPDLEHIVVDGGSTDGTVDALSSYAVDHQHVRWTSEKDQGVSSAINKGISSARASLVGILCVDDYYEPNVLNRALAILGDAREPAIIVGNCNIWNADGSLRYVNRPRSFRLQDLLLGPKLFPFPANPSAYFYHRSLHDQIGPYDDMLDTGIDCDFWLKAVEAADITHVDETWGNFRLLPGSKTMTEIEEGSIDTNIARIMENYIKPLPTMQRAGIRAIRGGLKLAAMLVGTVRRIVQK